MERCHHCNHLQKERGQTSLWQQSWLEKFLHVLCLSGFSAKLSTSCYLSPSVVFAMDPVPLICFLLPMLQEKCREQSRDLYLAFIDLTKLLTLSIGNCYGRFLENTSNDAVPRKEVPFGVAKPKSKVSAPIFPQNRHFWAPFRRDNFFRPKTALTLDGLRVNDP